MAWMASGDINEFDREALRDLRLQLLDIPKKSIKLGRPSQGLILYRQDEGAHGGGVLFLGGDACDSR